MNKYEIVNQQTGEIELFETNVDIDLIEAYTDWRVNNQLYPPQYTPQEYAEYLSLTGARQKVEKALDYISKLIDDNDGLSVYELEELEEILRNEK